MKDGIKVEEGSHQELAAKGGTYHNLVHAQQLKPLSLSEPEVLVEDMPHSQREERQFRGYKVYLGEDDESHQSLKTDQKIGFCRTFWWLVYEQTAHWSLYILTIVGAMGAGCKAI